MGGVGGRFVGHANLRRLELASLLWNAGEQVYLIELLVLAHQAWQGLGVAAVGILQAVPAVLLLPTLLRVTAGRPTDRLLRALIATRALAIGGAAALATAGAPFELILVLAAVDALAGTMARPARSVLIPAIARTPAELVSANVAVSTGRSVAGLVGPAVAAVLIAAGTGSSALWIGAALLTAAAVVTTAVSGAAPLPHHEHH